MAHVKIQTNAQAHSRPKTVASAKGKTVPSVAKTVKPPKHQNLTKGY